MGITGVKYPICDQNDHKNINFSFPPIWLGGGQNFNAQKSGGTKFQYTEIRGDKISVHGDSQITPPPPINNDSPLN